MPITKDAMGEMATLLFLKNAKEKEKAFERQMLAEGKTYYSIFIDSIAEVTDSYKPFLQTKSCHYCFWAFTEKEAEEMGLKQALSEGHKEPKINFINILKEVKKNKK